MSAVYVGNNRVLARTKYGHKMFLDSRDIGIAPHIMIDGVWEEWVGLAMSSFLPGVHFFDIGANVGWFTLLAVRSGAEHVYSFEPNPTMYGLLQDNVAVNGLSEKVTCYDHALGAEDGHAYLNMIEKYPGSNSMLGESKEARVKVAVKKLDHLWVEDAPRVFKIDVEGLEPQVVQGARQLIAAPATQALFIEYNSYSGCEQLNSMLDFLASESFVLGLVEESGEIRKISRSDLSNCPDAAMLCFRRFTA